MAAAYAALVSLFNNLELIRTHPRHSFSFDNKQIQSLLQTVCFFIDFMEASDYHGGGKEAAEALERQIASATHAAEDVIESHVVDQIDAGSTLDGEKRSVFLPDVQTVIEDMELVRRKAIKVEEGQSGFKLNKPTVSAATSSTPLTSSDKDKMVGFDDVLRQLLDLLTGYPSSRRVIPIVGTGGIGKTTLAKNAFQHNIIVEHFDVCLWVTISQQYVVKDILSKLLSGLKEFDSETVDEFGVRLHKSLYGRRYLIVLDDMWSVEAWDEMKNFFPDTSCGSRIIVTTRQSDVAACLDSSSLAMSFLEENESWDLFCEKAFAEQGCPSELEDIGKEIVRKCGGLPLAIVVVGGHLRMSPKTQEYWENLMKSILNLGENDDQLFDILYSSYDCLPVHLKPCFIYMGVFPEDEEIYVSGLIRLWIGEGFLKPNKDQTLEEVGEDCLNDLFGRNLILVGQQSSKKMTVKTCRIHDVLRVLCLEIAEKENLFCVHDTTRSIDKERRIVINRGEMPHALRSTHLVRSQITWEYDCLVLFDSKLLRVVRHVGNVIHEVENFFRRVNLRFVRGYFEKNSSMSLLWNLQTLIVQDYYKLAVAPFKIWEMTQLRHLSCEGALIPNPLLSDEANDIVLRHLQTLKYAVNLKLSDEVCKRIPNIKKLKMKYDDSEENYCDEVRSYPPNFCRLNKLESLSCFMAEDQEWHEFALALTFPSSLKKLELYEVPLDWEEMTMKLGSMPLLEILVLGWVKGGEVWNPVEGGFTRLRYLQIYNCPDLTNWNAESSHYPVLEHLHLYDVTKLDELACGIGEIPTLKDIDLRRCSVSLSISAARIVAEQETDYENHTLQLHVYFSDPKEEKSFNTTIEEEGLIINNLHLF